MIIEHAPGMGVPEMALDNSGCINRFGASLGKLWFSFDPIRSRSPKREELVSVLLFCRDLIYAHASERKQRILALCRYIGSGSNDEKLYYLIPRNNIPFDYGQTIDFRSGDCICWVDFWMVDWNYGDRVYFTPRSCSDRFANWYRNLIWYFDDMMGNRFFSIGGDAG
jgi:hypothetical protein